MNKNNKNVGLRSVRMRNLAHSVRGHERQAAQLLSTSDNVLNLNANKITSSGYNNQLYIVANFVAPPGGRPVRDGDTASLSFYDLNKITPDPYSINTINFYANDQLMLTLQVTYDQSVSTYKVGGKDSQVKVDSIKSGSTFDGYYDYIKNGELEMYTGYIMFKTNVTKR
jgi:hypothetical protein